MGNKSSIPKERIDLVHPLTANQRLIHLVYGYMRCYYDFNRRIFVQHHHTPPEVVEICLNYIDHIQIVSETELQIAYENGQKASGIMQSSNENYNLLFDQSNNAINNCPKNTPEIPEIRIGIFGNGGVGKSALTIRYVNNNFLDEYDPTIEDNYRKIICHENKKFLLDILDTAGQEEFSACLFDWNHYSNCRIFVFVYDITDRNSFEELQKNYINKAYRWKSDRQFVYSNIIRQTYDKGYFGIIVGNKCDLENERVVSIEDGMNLAIHNGNLLFVETSAKDKLNVEELFIQCMKLYCHDFLLYATNHYNHVEAKKMKKDNCCVM
eukprot:238818_1